MNKRILSIFSLVALIALGGCNKDNGNSSSSSNAANSQSSSTYTPNADTYEVKVVLPNGDSAGEGISVQWCSEGTCYDSSTNASGVAYKELEPGNYDVKLFGYPNTYAYQLGQVATADNRKLEIKLQEILEASPRYESDLENAAGSAYNPYIVGEGVYNVTVENEEDIQYFGFVPTRPGKYVVESLGTSLNLITANPFVSYYGNNPEYVNQIISKDDDSGYDVNFALEINIPIEEFANTGEIDKDGNLTYVKDDDGNYISGGIYTFGIGAKPVKSKKTFPFVVKWVDDYVLEKKTVTVINVEETLSQYPEKPEEYVWVDSNLYGLDTIVYNEEDGFYHVGTKEGYVLTAKISVPCNYIDRAFSKTVEDEEGNKSNEGIVGVTGIVLDNGTKDYTNFIQEYEKYCNSDGVYGVTQELKDFLELYFLTCRDWIEQKEESTVSDAKGWMFACGYYADIIDSYTKPWGGTGTSSDPYLLLLGTYYTRVLENQSVFYSYGLKNKDTVVKIFVKTENPNAKFIYDNNGKKSSYSSENGAYFEIELGGGMMTRNPDTFTLEFTSVDGLGTEFEFEIGIKEDLVDPKEIKVGDNTIEVLDSTNVQCTFVAPYNGVYTFTCEENNAFIQFNGTFYEGNKGKIIFTFNANINEEINFKITTLDLKKDNITFNIKQQAYADLGLNLAEVQIGKYGVGIENLDFIFIAPEQGAYEITSYNEDTVINYVSGNVSESKEYGEKFSFNLEAGDEVKFIVSRKNFDPGPAAFIVSKI